MSQEDPTIVVTPIMSNKFIGGAGIVAAHARSLGAKEVHFLSVVGNDEGKTYSENTLESYNVESALFVDESRPTTVKTRYRVGNKTMLRVNNLRQHKINARLQENILEHLDRILNQVDLVIFSDFNYGVLPQELVELISARCKKLDVMMVADSQSSSQVGDVSRFKDVSLLTPTEREARLALGNFDDGLVVLAQNLQKKSNAENIVITLGAEGLLVHAGNPEKTEWKTDNINSLNKSPKDTAGAGGLLACLYGTGDCIRRIYLEKHLSWLTCGGLSGRTRWEQPAYSC